MIYLVKISNDHTYKATANDELSIVNMLKRGWCVVTLEEYESTNNTAISIADIDTVKSECIAYSKTALADYLASHPLTWTDGKQYSVTEDKQAMLTSNLAAYQLAVTLGQENPELTWNATGEECTVWTFENLAALAIAIKAYVKPLVAYQQAAEVAINACTDADAVAGVPIDYGSVANV